MYYRSRLLFLSRFKKRWFANEGKKESGSISRFLLDLRSSSSDEQLRKNITEFEEKFRTLQHSESLKSFNEIINKSSQGLAATRNEATKLATKMGDAVATASRPVQDIAKKVKPHLPDISQSELIKNASAKVDKLEQTAAKSSDLYRYGGVSSKETRRAFEASMKVASIEGSYRENPDAGSAVVHVKNVESSKVWKAIKRYNPFSKIVERIYSSTNGSDNIIAHMGRNLISSVSNRFASLFSESEAAKAITLVRSRRPNFSIDEFLKALRGYVVPEILESIVTGDLINLRKWCSEGAFKVLEASIEPSVSKAHKLCGQILDIRDLELVAAKVIDDRPLIIISLQAQQLFSVRDAGGNLVEGSNEQPELVQYVMAFSPDEAKVNPSGWCLVEVAIRDKNSSW